MLDVDNSLDIYALQFIFLPIIQSQLDIFREGWAHHLIRTERNRSPMQLWILGLSEMQENNPHSNEVSSVEVGLHVLLVCMTLCSCYYNYTAISKLIRTM